MRRSLELDLEACDALLGLLRLHAASEVHRWPAHLSGVLVSAVADEMDRIEETVRTLGMAYEHLESHGVATLDRTPQSRFSDVDEAFHLVACPVALALDLDALRVALDRGDADTRDEAVRLSHALRTVIASVAESELLVCRRLLLAGAEQPPDRVLRFVDAYLASAWPVGAKPQASLPSMLPVALGYEVHPSLTDVSTSAHSGGDSTAVFRLDAELEDL